MTYFGLLFQDEEPCGDKVREWLDSHKEDILKIGYVMPEAFQRVDCPIGDLSELEGLDFGLFRCFEEEEKECFFFYEGIAYNIEIVELPCDKWGNTATEKQAPECIWIALFSYPASYVNDEWRHFIQNRIGDDYSVESFVKWVESLGDDERAGKIKDNVMTGRGSYYSWCYITIKDEESLMKLMDEYLLLPDEE